MDNVITHDSHYVVSCISMFTVWETTIENNNFIYVARFKNKLHSASQDIKTREIT